MLRRERMIVTVSILIFKYVIKYWLTVFNFQLTFIDKEIICGAQHTFLDVRDSREILCAAWFMRWLILHQLTLHTLIFICSIDSLSLRISWMIAYLFCSILNFYFIFQWRLNIVFGFKIMSIILWVIILSDQSIPRVNAVIHYFIHFIITLWFLLMKINIFQIRLLIFESQQLFKLLNVCYFKLLNFRKFGVIKFVFIKIRCYLICESIYFTILILNWLIRFPVGVALMRIVLLIVFLYLRNFQLLILLIALNIIQIRLSFLTKLILYLFAIFHFFL